MKKSIKISLMASFLILSIFICYMVVLLYHPHIRVELRELTLEEHNERFIQYEAERTTYFKVKELLEADANLKRRINIYYKSLENSEETELTYELLRELNKRKYYTVEIMQYDEEGYIKEMLVSELEETIGNRPN